MSKLIRISRDASGPSSQGAYTQVLADRGRRAPDVGAQLGRYELRGLLGEGGMGAVLEAFDPVLERAVAIKVLRDTEAHRGEQSARLLREATTMARLSHPNVIRVYDAGTDRGHTFVAMELVRGCTLAEWYARAPRSADDVIDAYVQAGRGLAAAHDAGLVHRDFKPQNVLVGDDGRVLVTDFGLARSVNADEPSTTSRWLACSTPSVTAPGEIVGTPAFMAPEQRTGGTIDVRTDQYSFCLALWRALSGPVIARPTETTIQASSPPLHPLSDLPRVPARIRRALQRGLAESPDARFPSMHELLAVLEGSLLRVGRMLAAKGVLATLAATIVASAAQLRRLIEPAPAEPSRHDRRATSTCSAATRPVRRQRLS